MNWEYKKRIRATAVSAIAPLYPIFLREDNLHLSGKKPPRISRNRPWHGRMGYYIKDPSKCWKIHPPFQRQLLPCRLHRTYHYTGSKNNFVIPCISAPVFRIIYSGQICRSCLFFCIIPSWEKSAIKWRNILCVRWYYATILFVFRKHLNNGITFLSLLSFFINI